jgi:hypothetical protein
MSKPKDTEITKVVFRKWPDGTIDALFPELKWWGGSSDCTSYQHIGQHGPADYFHCISKTKLALPPEYKALKKELESIGYNLKVIKKYTRK